MTATVSGSRMSIVVPLPGCESMLSVPRSDSTLRRTTSIPTPRPEMSLTSDAVEKPGRSVMLHSSCRESRSGSMPSARVRSAMTVSFNPPPSSVMRNTMPPDWCSAVMRIVPTAFLPRASANVRRFEAVIDGVADHVRDRILQLLDDGGVDFDVLTFEHEHGALALRRGEVAHDAVEVAQRRTDRHEAHVHDRFLQIEAEAIELADGVEQFLVARCLFDELPHVAAHGGDLAGEVEHAVELLDADAKRARGTRRRAGCCAIRVGGDRAAGEAQQHRVLRIRERAVAVDGADGDVAQDVDRFEQLADAGHVRFDAAFAHAVEQLLDDVRGRVRSSNCRHAALPLSVCTPRKMSCSSSSFSGVCSRRSSVCSI